jgi:phosphatidylserine/phosphatidylglycerophosphate/cardiolipin synthase-like enzyme
VRFKSQTKGGVQVFAVAGTDTVSFGIRATPKAREGLLGFAIERVDPATGGRRWMPGYKVFRSIIAEPNRNTVVSTFDHPMQSLVWDDFTVDPGQRYDYVFHPLRGTPAHLDRSAAPVTVSVTTEKLSEGVHDIFFNRGVTSSQAYAKRFNNKSPDKQPTPEKKAEALAWLSRDLDEALIGLIDSAKKGDAIRGCFYEFRFAPVLAAFKAAIDRGVDVKLIVDMKVNEHWINPTDRNGLTRRKWVPSNPREANISAIEEAGLPDAAIIERVARRDSLQHNKFMVLLRGKTARKPAAVWTGSTNLTDGGIYGQANVGHVIRDERTAGLFLQYWNVLEADPGAPTSATKHELNVAFRDAVDRLSPTPKSVKQIPIGVTPLFSPRANSGPLDLYVKLLADAKTLSCGTFAFGIPQPFRVALDANGPTGPLCFLLLEKRDNPKPTKANPGPVIRLNSRNNTYKASGSELDTPLGKWVAETNNKALKLNVHVVYVHLKFLLHDPLGPDPIVVTGSANFSEASTKENDENMVIIRGDRRVADIYFTEFNRLWGHYQYRSVVEAVAKQPTMPGSPIPHNYQDLWETTEWQRDYEPGDLRSKRVEQYVRMSI